VNRVLIDKYQTTLDTILQQDDPITDRPAPATPFIDDDEAATPPTICEEIDASCHPER
jgi:hypothetical protein